MTSSKGSRRHQEMTKTWETFLVMSQAWKKRASLTTMKPFRPGRIEPCSINSPVNQVRLSWVLTAHEKQICFLSHSSYFPGRSCSWRSVHKFQMKAGHLSPSHVTFPSLPGTCRFIALLGSHAKGGIVFSNTASSLRTSFLGDL